VLVEDRESAARTVSRLLAFDLLVMEGNPLWKQRMDKRLQCLQNEVIAPRKQDKDHDFSGETCHIRMKDHFKLAKTASILTKFLGQLTHPAEGLIFTDREGPYGMGGFENSRPLFKFVEGGAMSFDGSISKKTLLEGIAKISE
jgi:hypothetical protein